MRIQRLFDGPIISADLHPSIGSNIQGPSMIRAPDTRSGGKRSFQELEKSVSASSGPSWRISAPAIS